MCKRKGYSYELKEVIELLSHKMTDDPMHNKDIKKVGPDPERGGRGVLTPGRTHSGSTEAEPASHCNCGRGFPGGTLRTPAPQKQKEGPSSQP